MIVLLVAVTLLIILAAARRALEPECPSCAAKCWCAHSTQLQCIRCGWSANRVPVEAAAEPQYEICFNRSY
jgi:hypothetical protein